ncbi:MAG: site-2 protease family protein [Coriobacteriia bacterium]|nr:site-2 protease family protein [Coriobacteriia bacterium]
MNILSNLNASDAFFTIGVTLLTIVLAMFAIVLHEISHGYVANVLGDPTAKNAGRLTLNPIAHIDPVGTIALPVLMGLMGGPIFGFAKPVPYNPNYFENLRRGELLVALAGPGSNLLQAIVGGIIFRLFSGPLASAVPETVSLIIVYLAMSYVQVNLVLMFFNLIPLPPLDGSAIIAPFLSDKALQKYYRVQQYSLPILLGLFFLVPYVTGYSPIDRYLNFMINAVFPLIMGS